MPIKDLPWRVSRVANRRQSEGAGHPELLARIPGLGDVSAEELEELATSARVVRYPSGGTVIAEGSHGDDVYVIADGEAELTTDRDGRLVRLATLKAGDVVGQLALAIPDHRRNATLTASRTLTALVLGRDVVLRFIRSDPARVRVFEESSRQLLVARFIREVGAFATLDDQQRQWLASRVRRRHAAAGEELCRKGEPGISCFIIRRGSADVTDGDERLAVIGPGSVFGEAAVLTASPRVATVQAREPCEILELSRDDLTAVLSRNPAAAREMTLLFRLRERPRQAACVEVHQRRDEEGRLITTLKNPELHTYYRLSEQATCIWNLLDGRRTLRDLTLEYFERYGAFDPTAVAHVVAGLARTGMLADSRVATSALAEGTSGLGRVARGARSLLTWSLELRAVDRPLELLYRSGARHLFTRTGRVLVVGLALAAMVLWLAEALPNGLFREQRIEYAALLFPGLLLNVLLHELAHGLAVKHHGREVPGAGVGWYWLKPIAYVNTSDMWLAPRRARIEVSLAGPLASALLGGMIGVAALLVTDDQLATALWVFALPAYVSVIVNLSPVLELDGYYILSDLTDRPNLRDEAFDWIRTGLPAVIKRRAALGRHRLELLYSAGSAAFLLVMAIMLLTVWRLILERWIDGITASSVATALAWAFAVSNLFLFGIVVFESVRRPRTGSAV